jgi:outer membrane lipoprotein-sorting protein
MTEKTQRPVLRSARVILLGLLVVAFSVSATTTLTGREIMETQRKLHHLQDEEELRLMIMVDASGRERRRELSGYVMSTNNDQYKLLLRFQSPRDVRDTSLLVWENETGDADQWLYLPAFRKVKRIPSSSKKNRFMGTDFAYEDLRRESLKLYDYKLIGSETLDGLETFVVEARPGSEAVASDTGYSKRKFWIDKERFLTLKAEFYDKAGRLWKVLTNKDFVHLQDAVWAPNEIEMRDVQNGTKTTVIIEDRKVNQGLSPSLFTEMELRRGQ